MMTLVGVLVLICAIGANGSAQLVFQHGLHPHQQHPPPPSHPVGSPQFPRFSKCMKTESEETTEGKQWELWQREYGCSSLFASIAVLAQSTTVQPPTASTSTPSTTTTSTTTEPLPPGEYGPKKPDEHPDLHHTEQERINQLANSQYQRYRSHRAGGLFAGVGLTSDFYAGGFGRYSRIAAAAQQDPFAWRYASSPNDVRVMTIELPQHDALDEMTNERRRRDIQTCADFRILASKVVAGGSLENVCCNIMCYCDDIQNVTGVQDRCGTPELPSANQKPNRPPAASVIDAVHGRHTPETSVSLTENELNGTENGTAPNTTTPAHGRMVHPTTTVDPTMWPSTTSKATGGSSPTPATTTVDPFHPPSSSSTPTTTESPAESALFPIKKVHEIVPGHAGSEKARRPVWTPLMASPNGDNLYQSSTNRKSYQFGVPEEWGNFVQGDTVVARTSNVRGGARGRSHSN